MSIDMSPRAITARLRLTSQLREFCLKLGRAKIRPRQTEEHEQSGEAAGASDRDS
jgi:hypothetical protein